MIVVDAFAGRRVLILGLGRSGLATARALIAGGAEVLGWDDGAEARATAEAQGIALADPARDRTWQGLAALIVSPGIPHLYPAPHPAVARAFDEGVAVDNDVGLFFVPSAGRTGPTSRPRRASSRSPDRTANRRRPR